MIISSTFRESDKGCCTQCCQRSVHSIEQRVRRKIVGRLNPFAFEDSPKSLGNVKMRRIRWQEKKIKTSFLPNRAHFHHKFTTMYSGIVKYNECLLFDGHGEFVKEFSHFFSCNTFCSIESHVIAVITYHTEDIESFLLLGRDGNLLPRKCPAIRDVALGADMALITEIKVYQIVVKLTHKLLQLLQLILIELRRGFPLWTFSYTSKSCAKADKKLLNVLLHASLPVASCHLSLAFITLSLSFCIASMTFSVSDESMIGFAPWPGLFRRPSIPDLRYLFTHRLTVRTEEESSSAIDFDERPSAFNNIYWQRFCMKGLGSKCNTYSNSTRCFFVRFTSVILIVVYLTSMQKSCQHIIIYF